jgi:hypothetical protein
MKKIFCILILAFSFVAINAQTSVNFTGTDTVVNTGVESLNLKVSNAHSVGAFQIVVDKVSGTVAGNAIFQGSVDGVNFVNIDTLATTNVTKQTKIFIDAPVKYPFYRVTYTGTGTMAAIIRGQAHFKGKL